MCAFSLLLPLSLAVAWFESSCHLQYASGLVTRAVKCQRNVFFDKSAFIITRPRGVEPAAAVNKMRLYNNNNNNNNNDKNHGNTNIVPTNGITNPFQRILLATTAQPFLAHNEPLPPPARKLISPRARLILQFVAEYLAHLHILHGWPIQLYASGGYVRDLLLGRISPDLDLSLGLSSCRPEQNVTIQLIAEGMDDFSQSRPDLDIRSVKVITSRKSKTAQQKNMDAALVEMTIGGIGEGGEDVVSIDLLPTIKSETYGVDDRVPVRDPRGTAEEDSLRRDLTIGSMLLEVSLDDKMIKEEDRNNNQIMRPRGIWKRRMRSWMWKRRVKSLQTRVPSDNLRFVLLDYHGGIEDLSTRTLRCPVPNNATLDDIWSQVIQSTLMEDDALSNMYATGNTRALWWAVMLHDDPIRLLRTLRFKETLGFFVDSSFWSSVPFALQPGIFDTKVSNTRKIEELRKVAAGAGVAGLINFLFTVVLPPIGGSELRNAFFSVSLFPEEGALYVDRRKAQRLSFQHPRNLSLDERIALGLVVSLFCVQVLEMKSSDEAAIDSKGDDSIGIISQRLQRTLSLVEEACDGLQAPNTIRRPGIEPLYIAHRLLEPLPVEGMNYIFVNAVDLPSGGASIDEQARQFE